MRQSRNQEYSLHFTTLSIFLSYTYTFEAIHLSCVCVSVRGEMNRTLVEADMMGREFEAEFKRRNAPWSSAFLILGDLWDINLSFMEKC